MSGRILASAVTVALGALLVGWGLTTPARDAATAHAAQRRLARVRPAPGPAPPPAGAVVGRIRIPSLDLSATVLQGTGLSVLARAPGHWPASPLPGAPGDAVIAAHDDTFFAHLDRLRAGATVLFRGASGITYVFRVAASRVMGPHQGLAREDWPTLTLFTCYPLTARGFTPDRYVVVARLVGSRFPRARGARA